MTNQELVTCALEGIPIKIAVINNQSLGMVRQWQTLFYQGRYSNTDLKTNRIPDFPKLAEAMGCVGLRAEEPDDVDAVIEKALRSTTRRLWWSSWCTRTRWSGRWWPQAPATTTSRWPATWRRSGTRRSCERRPITHTLSVLVENKPGVLARIAGLISRRGYNIESLAVGPTESPEMSRITLPVNVDDVVLEQITKQLNKLIEVLKIVELDRRARSAAS